MDPRIAPSLLCPQGRPRRFSIASAAAFAPITRWAINADLQAGLLISGSAYSLRLPIRLQSGQWHLAGFVPGYSGGTMPDLHRLPFYAPKGACNMFLVIGYLRIRLHSCQGKIIESAVGAQPSSVSSIRPRVKTAESAGPGCTRSWSIFQSHLGPQHAARLDIIVKVLPVEEVIHCEG